MCGSFISIRPFGTIYAASLSQDIFDIPLDSICLLQALLGFGVKATFHSPSFAVCRTCDSASAMLCQQT